jgi:lipooligosaccharide transport system ATP-binding protein
MDGPAAAATSFSKQAAVEAAQLTKHYGDTVAVDGISFEVRAGECFGLLGPNGAGKTTTIRMITCSSPITSGQLVVSGHDVSREPRQVKSRIGVVPQDENLDPDLPTRQNLEVYARYFGLPRDVIKERVSEQLAFFELEGKAKDPVNTLSGGMRRRLLIARALIHQPDLLVLDEPTVGLDPQARHLVWQQLRRLRERGVTQLLTTHYMDEAAQLCDRIVVMHHGTILAEGTPRSLVRDHAGERVLELHIPSEQRDALLAEARSDAIEVEAYGDVAYLFGDEAALTPIAHQIGDDFRALLRPANLEDVFLRLTGRELVE